MGLVKGVGVADVERESDRTTRKRKGQWFKGLIVEKGSVGERTGKEDGGEV